MAFILCIIITFTPLLYFLETKAKSINMDQVEHQTLLLVDSKSNEIGSWLLQRISEIRIIEEFAVKEDFQPRNIKPYLSNLNKSVSSQYGNLNETFAIGSVDGRGWVNNDITINIFGRDYFNKVMSSDMEYIISNPIISKSDNKPIFVICYPLVNDDNEKVGFINGAVSLDKLSEITRSINVYDGFSWIMNKNMDIYTISKESLVANFVSDTILQDVIDHSTIKNSGTVYVKNAAGKPSTLFYASVPYTQDWLLCTLIENNNIHAGTNSLISMLTKAGLLLLALAVLLAVTLSSTIVRPIYRLKSHMMEVSKGNLDSVFESKNNDEISVLGKVFNLMLRDIKVLISKVYDAEKQKRTFELRALQSQINPHFLYNTLDTIQWKALEYKAFDLADMIHSLSTFFRLSLNDGKELITIADELDHVKSYLEIQSVRYKETVKFVIQADEEASQCLIPKMTLQPLVENSIYHGLKLKKNTGEIAIKAYIENNSVTLSVEDNGIGMTALTLSTLRENLDKSLKSDHYGLFNVNERLKLTFDDKYSIHIESKWQEFTKVTINIPKVKEDSYCLD